MLPMQKEVKWSSQRDPKSQKDLERNNIKEEKMTERDIIQK